MRGLPMHRFPFRLAAALALTGLAWANPASAAEGDDEYTLRWANGLRTEDLRFNALSANRSANPQMVQVPLRSDLYALWTGDLELRDQLEDPSARAFMGYVVSCALAPGQSLQWVDRKGVSYQWHGRIGLCPEWATGPASLSCQRWVSACVLARNNAYDRRVLLSGRGYKASAPDLFLPRPAVRTEPFREYTRVRVASTLACRTPRSGVTRDCGFQLERVGRCRSGERVHVGAGGIPPDSSCASGSPLGRTVTGTMMLRVCEGLGACDSSEALAQSDGTCGTSLPAVSFDCPASETFSVISGPYDSTASGEVEPAASPNALYSAPEDVVFHLREGAFFGNLFGPNALAQGVDVHVDANGDLQNKPPPFPIMDAIYKTMFACAAPDWTYADAYATSRVCTKPNENCVAEPLGRCDAYVSAGSYSGPRCQYDNASGYGDYGRCVNPSGGVHMEVVTPYLNRACDVVDDQLKCQRTGGVAP